MVEISNIIKQKERIEKIKSICNKIKNDKINKEEYYKSILQLGYNIKNSILYDIYNNNKNFLSYESIQNIRENSPEFIQYVLSSVLKNNQIVCTIEKNTSCEEEAMITFQLIASG